MKPDLDRFAQGLPDPQDVPEESLFIGECVECTEPIARGESALILDSGDLVHEDDCFELYARKQLGAREYYGPEE